MGSLAAPVAPAPPATAAPGVQRRRLRDCAYADVTLGAGPTGDMYRRVHSPFLNLDEDRLLKVYRQRDGMRAPGRDMGEWYDADGFVPGHLIRQFISGLSRSSAHTGDAVAPAKTRRLLLGCGATVEKDGYAFASPKARNWACYIPDKYHDGMIEGARVVMLAAMDPPEALEADSAALARMNAVPGKALEFQCRTASGPVRMLPFYRVQRERYSTYWRRVGDA